MKASRVVLKVLLGATSLASLLTPLASAQISPGPLSEPHAQLEGSRNCLSCHHAEKGVDPALCLDCHEALGQRVSAGLGLHARPELASCERCHSEHNGREFELVFWEGGRERFDHARTGWALQGRHVGLDCAKCHRPDRVDPALLRLEPALDPGRTYLGLSTACTACHEDPHRGSMKAASCTECHSQESWKSPRGFDHAATRYPLTGRHATVACADCHRPEAPGAPALFFGQYAGAALPACADCHRDPHAGRLGRDCASCHSTASFRTGLDRGFDHERTRYPLRGKHRAVACAECHTAGRGLRIAGAERCETCHRDPHAGQLRTVASRTAACADCHTVDGFRPGRFGPD
ncbi:MAG TPA: cytochrome c3 family protein, partial [Thermoanaerobaculia bacterium]|nr:cytochrome c3 family protein [Thermoanaerobaculia bacterium]